MKKIYQLLYLVNLTDFDESFKLQFDLDCVRCVRCVRWGTFCFLIFFGDVEEAGSACA